MKKQLLLASALMVGVSNAAYCMENEKEKKTIEEIVNKDKTKKKSIEDLTNENKAKQQEIEQLKKLLEESQKNISNVNNNDNQPLEQNKEEDPIDNLSDLDSDLEEEVLPTNKKTSWKIPFISTISQMAKYAQEGYEDAGNIGVPKFFSGSSEKEKEKEKENDSENID